MLLKELLHDVGAKDVRHATVVLRPTANVLVRIRPEEVADEPCVRHVGRAHQAPDLLEVGYLWGEASVHANDLLVDEAADWQAIEHVAELLPELDIVSSLTLVVESVYPCDGGALVVSTELEEVVGELYLVAEHERDGFQTLLATVNVVPQEDVAAIGWEASVLEDTEEVVVLAVHISTDLQWRLQLEERALRQEHSSRRQAQSLQLGLRDLHQLPRLLATDLQAPVDAIVDVELLRLFHRCHARAGRLLPGGREEWAAIRRRSAPFA
mmetsp:Transcript_47027/g.132279  ORF Transcript_47027/g.132279 Transcript_47027/m.132279 type:complete len:268 (-) Transcript_47027:27-830(-)